MLTAWALRPCSLAKSETCTIHDYSRSAPPSKAKRITLPNNTRNANKATHTTVAISVYLLHASILFCCSNVKTWSDILMYKSRRAAPAPPTRALAILCLRASCVRSRRTTPRRRQACAGNVCDDDVVVMHTSRTTLPTTSATSPRTNKTCSTHCTTVNIPFRTTCRDIWETTQTWPLPTNV